VIDLSLYTFTRKLSKEKPCDVLVVGGGIAGVSAAIAAKHAGAHVMLIEQFSVLGGTATARGVGAFCGETKRQGEVFDEIVRDLKALNAIAPYKPYEQMEARPFDHEILKFVLQEFMMREDIDLLLHTRMVGVDVSDKHVEGVIIHNSTGLQATEPKVVIDATGDGFVVHGAGFPCNKGRESDGKTLPMSMMFFMRDIGKCPQTHLSKVCKEYSPEDLPMVSIWPEPDGKVGVKVKVINYDSTDGRSLTEAELFARREMMSIVYYLQHHPCYTSHPTAPKVFLEKYKFDYASMQIGIREGWRTVGEYVLTLEDVKHGQKFDDGIALGRFYIDALSPDTTKRVYMIKNKEDWYVPPYHIPYCSLVPKGSKNLLVAGRCFSADQMAMSSARVMTTASMMGQAAGRAAAMMADYKKEALEVDVNRLRKDLSDRGAEI
jgi:hypothetical protein